MMKTRSEGREKKRNRKRVTPLNPPTIIKEEEPALSRKTQVHFDYMINFDAPGINSL
jgi:hypothetical protein